MQKALKKLFINDGFFAVAAILGFVGELISTILYSIYYPQTFTENIMNTLMGICTLLLYLSYKNHSKNVMKALMGAVLMAMLSSAIGTLTIGNFGDNTVVALDIVFALILLVITLLLFANHLSINSEHRASPKKVFFNQVLCIFIPLLIIAWDMCYICQLQECVASIANIVGNTGVVASIVCVESRLDAYRLDREAAGWTEETGYPEGYVHEYEKK